MVAVAQHHGVDILAVARVDHGRVVVGCLRLSPAVEGLIDHQHADRVAGIEESPCRGVVRGADQVKAGRLHLPHLADLCGIEGHRPQHTVVVMHAGTVDQHLPAVEHKAIFSIERERADTELHRFLVDHLSFLLQSDNGLVEIGIVGRPQMGLVDGEAHAAEGRPAAGKSAVLLLEYPLHLF